MASDTPQLPLLEKLDLIPAHLAIVGAAIYAAVTGPFRGEEYPKQYSKHVGRAAVRKMMGRLSVAQAQYMNGSTAKAYGVYAKKKRTTPETVELKDGAKGHWIGKKDAKNVLIYYHGGGFAFPADPVYFHYYSDLMDDLNAAGKDIAILVLSYTLMPHAVYPTQIGQGVEILRYVLNETPRKPSNVIIGGDSAGGNMTAAVLSHLSHPHKSIQPLELSEPLRGAFMIAPWVSFSADFPSITSNQYRDSVTNVTINQWSDMYLNGKPSDNYTEALLAPEEWWKGVMAQEVLILAGSDEILRDSIKEFAKKFEAANPGITTTVIAAGEIHVAPILERMLGDMNPTEQGKALESWMSSRL